MLYFIPAWYQQNNWREDEQNWHARRTKTEFDDTVKHIQLFHRSKAYPFRVMLLSYAPNFRHFLHRQSIFHVPYWSIFDGIQEIRRKKISMFSFHNLNWPKNIEFIYTPFVLVAKLAGEKYAQVEFGEDGNTIQIDMYKGGVIQRRNIYDDRGFVSSTIIYEQEKPIYQDYLNDKGLWKIRHYLDDGHVEVNPKSPSYILEHNGEEHLKMLRELSYPSMEAIIEEVLVAYLALTSQDDMFCVAMHKLHIGMLERALHDRKMILSYYGDRYNVKEDMSDISMIEAANYAITDSRDNLRRIQRKLGREAERIVDITPFDSRVDFGISLQLSVQQILVPVDGMDDDRFQELIRYLGEYLPTNDSARVHLFTRVSDYNRPKKILEQTRKALRYAGMDERWAMEETKAAVAENDIDAEEGVSAKFVVEQCVSELSVSKCMRGQRIILDMRKSAELYLRIMGISVGIPQIVARENQFVEDGKNGKVLKDMADIGQTLDYYLQNMTNWNKAMVYSYELGKKYTTSVLIKKWKEVIDIVEHD
ncbi:MAG: accessory Sec system protein Asp1 [Lachnospiraceae bacterium]|nr:accessory Sec system protein Asp1 [Lachnospiraceae bacterium]